MANTDKNIVITPNIGSANDPQIVFSGADASTAAQNITLKVYPNNNGTLSFEGSAGQLFSITNSFLGTIFSVNDVSGIPSIEVLDTGLVKIAQYGGNVLVGTGTDNGTDKLQVNGNITASVLKSTVAQGTAPFIVTSTTKVDNLNADLLDGFNSAKANTANTVVVRDTNTINATTFQGIELTSGAVATEGTVTGTWTLTAGSAWTTTAADLAEWYQSDQEYEHGTVLIVGGPEEVIISTTANDTRVAGVVSTAPGFVMSVDLPGPSACVALQGKVPVKVIGQVQKGDLLVSSDTPGYAMVNNAPAPYTVIGKALENKTTDGQGIVKAIVSR